MALFDGKRTKGADNLMEAVYLTDKWGGFETASRQQ
jgi:hypothetical protein